MPTPDLSTHGSTLPVLRSKRIVDISTEDYINERGFIAVVQADGDLHYVTLEDDELTETLSAGDTAERGPSTRGPQASSVGGEWKSAP